jgi:CO/xanthine dehydrogenase Mo-binding subunit
VTAGDPQTARRAVAAIKADWDQPAAVPVDLESYLRTHQVDGEGWQRAVSSQTGDTDAALAAAVTGIEATYTTAYLAHVPLETRAAVAEWEDGRLTVWTGTNVPFAVRARLSQAFGIDEAAIRVIVPPVGGGFGGKHGDEAIEAARLARDSGRPVMVHWSRAEEFQWGFLRPMAVIDVRAGLDAAGSIIAWDFLSAGHPAWRDGRWVWRGTGLAISLEKGGRVATCAEILADTAGQVQVRRIVTAYECGAVVNPDTVISQIEGGTVMALGGALFESVAFARGRVASTSLSGYRVPRFTDVPELDVVLLDRADLPAAGAGETPLIAVAPAIANAIFAATGRRLRSLPLLPHGRT